MKVQNTQGPGWESEFSQSIERRPPQIAAKYATLLRSIKPRGSAPATRFTSRAM
jgi:hypothetical protein